MSIAPKHQRAYLGAEKITESMKKLYSALFLPLISLGLTAILSAEPANVRVDFVKPENFTDFRIQGRQENVSAGIFRDQISAYLSPIVAKRFPGDSLNLKFTDIDLAGRIDLSRPRQLSNLRIDRNVASPLRLYFDFTLTDSKGKILASGSKSLVDPDYLYRYIYYSERARSATLFYEKATLDRWIDTLTLSKEKVAAAK
jgi:hypothetical protein